MHDIISFAITHWAAIAGVAGYVILQIANAQPPLSENAGYYTRWAYGTFQALAANGHKH